MLNTASASYSGNRTYVYLFMILYAVTVFVQEIAVVPSLFYLRILLITIAFIAFGLQDSMVIYVFLVPFNSGLALYYVQVCFALSMLCKMRFRIPRSHSLSVLLVFLLWELAHLILVECYSSALIIVMEFGFAIVLLSFVLFVQRFDFDRGYDELVNSWVLSVLLSCAVLYAKYIKYYGLNGAFSASRGIGSLPTDGPYSLVINPNGVSRLCFFSILLILVRYYYRDRCKGTKKILSLLCLALLVLFGVSSLSMSFIVMTPVFTALFFLGAILRCKNASAYLSFIVLLGLVLTVMYLLASTYFEAYIERLYGELVSDKDISGGRLDIYQTYGQMFIGRPLVLLLGVGLQDYPAKLVGLGGLQKPVAAHNVILEVVAAWGLVGLALITYFFYSLLKDLRCRPGLLRNWLACIPGLGILMFAHTGNFFLGHYYVTPFLILSLATVKHGNDRGRTVV